MTITKDTPGMTQPPVEASQPFSKALPALFLIAFVFLLIFLCRVIFSPLLPSVQAEMGFSHSQAGRLFFFLAVGGGMGLGLYSMLPLYLISDHQFQRETANQLLALSRITGLLGTLVSGYFTDRIGAKRTLAFYFIFAGASSALLGLSHGPLLVVAVFIQPVAATCFFPAGLTALSKAFTAEFRSVAVSLIIPVATLFGQGLVPAMLGYLGQQGVFYLGFVIMGGMLVTGVLPLPFLKFIRESDLVFAGAHLAPIPSSSPNPDKIVVPK